MYPKFLETSQILLSQEENYLNLSRSLWQDDGWSCGPSLSRGVLALRASWTSVTVSPEMGQNREDTNVCIYIYIVHMHAYNIQDYIHMMCVIYYIFVQIQHINRYMHDFIKHVLYTTQ